MYSKLMAALDTKKTEPEFQTLLDLASKFIHYAIEQKSPVLSKLICEVFKRKLAEESKSSENDKLSDIISNKLKSQLFIASDSQRSKNYSVIADLVSQDAQIVQNTFTRSLLRMLTADSVNMLKNIRGVEIQRAEDKKIKIPWKQAIKKMELYGSDGGHNHYNDGQKVVDDFPDSELPFITEFGVYMDRFVKGIKIVYSNGFTVERKGDPHTDYKSLQLLKGEYITLVHGRTGCWTDQIRIETNFGRKLMGGNTDGGGDKSPEYPRKAYIIGMDLRFHHSLTRSDVYYVDLAEVPMVQEDPLVSLISESDILSKGIEKRHMGDLFSKAVLQEIQTVQQIIGKPILDSSQLDSTSATSNSSNMINTVPAALANNGEEDLHLQIIHEGMNP